LALSTEHSRRLRFIGQVERDARNAVDLVLAVHVGIEAAALVVDGLDAARLTEIDAAGQFAHDQDVEVGHQLRLQRRGRRQRLEQQRRPQVGEQLEPGAQPQQTAFRALEGGQIVPLRSAHRAEQHGPGLTRLGQRLFRQAASGLVDGGAAHQSLGEMQGISKRVPRPP
jgi:hypothetical protein